MVLATRCPHCETVFRVQDVQLTHTRGLVRCGHCGEVFDATQNVLDPASASTAGLSQETKEHEAPTLEARDAASAQSENVIGEAHGAMGDAADEAHEPPRESSLAPTHPMQGETDKPLAGSPQPTQVEPHEPSPTPAYSMQAEAHEPLATPAHPRQPAPFTPASSEQDTWTAQQPPPTFADILADELREPTLSEAPGWDKAGHAPDSPEHVNGERAAPEGYAWPRSEKNDEPRLGTVDTPGATWRADAEPGFRTSSAPEHATPAGRAPHPDEPPSGLAEEPMRPFEVTREARTRAPRSIWLGAIGALVALVLVVLLVAQLAWWRREAVMVYWPSTQWIFSRACERLGCQISPPRDIDGLQVEAPDLRQTDGPHRLELRLPLHNRFGIALAYPAIELTLFDEKNQAAVRRVLWPQDYAPPGAPIAAGLPPQSTQTMIIQLDSGNVVATSFHVQIFYP